VKKLIKMSVKKDLKTKEFDSVVKIDGVLLKKVGEIIKKEENKYRFANKKQFIDFAVYEFLNKIGIEARNGKK